MPRDLWLPTIIEHAISIKFVTYVAKSVKKISLPQTRAFMKKFHKKPNLNAQFKISYSGRNHKIRVKHQNSYKYYHFSDIAICICDDRKLPKISNPIDKTLTLFSAKPELLRVLKNNKTRPVKFPE